jgi:hypothetical protein
MRVILPKGLALQAFGLSRMKEAPDIALREAQSNEKHQDFQQD